MHRGGECRNSTLAPTISNNNCCSELGLSQCAGTVLSQTRNWGCQLIPGATYTVASSIASCQWIVFQALPSHCSLDNCTLAQGWLGELLSALTLLRAWYKHEASSLWLGPQQKVGKWQVCKCFHGTELVHLQDIKNQKKKKPKETALERSRKKHQGRSLFNTRGLEFWRLELPTDSALGMETSLSFWSSQKYYRLPPSLLCSCLKRLLLHVQFSSVLTKYV